MLRTMFCLLLHFGSHRKLDPPGAAGGGAVLGSLTLPHHDRDHGVHVACSNHGRKMSTGPRLAANREIGDTPLCEYSRHDPGLDVALG